MALMRRRFPLAKTELTPKEAEATALGEYKFGFHDDFEPVFRTQRGLNEEIVREISAYKSEPQWMTDYRVKAYRHFVERDLPAVGRQPEHDRLRQHLLLPEAGRGAGQGLGRPAARDEGHVGQAGHPRGREEVPGRRRRPVRVRGRLPQPAEGAGRPGRHLRRHRQRPARARGSVPRVLRHGHPVQRQQVRGAQLGRLVGWLVHLRAARESRSSCRCRPTSASTPRTWASSSAR